MSIDRTQVAEIEVIAACLADGAHAIDAASDYCDETDFAHPDAAAAMRAMRQLVARGEPVDVVTVSCAVGGGTWNLESGMTHLDQRIMAWLADLQSSAWGARDVVHHAKRVRTASRLRRLASACRVGLDRCQDVDDVPDAADQVADTIIEDVLRVGDAAKGATSIAITSAIRSMLDEFKARKSTPIEQQYARTGIAALDEIIEGLRPGHMYLVGGASGHGKTAWLTYLAAQAADRGGAVLYATAEVPAEAIAQRITACLADVDGRALERMDLDRDETVRVVAVAHRIKSWQMSILDAPAITIGLLDREVRRRLQREQGQVGVLVVDYLQLVRASQRHGNREQEVAEVADGLLELAKRHKIAVVVGAQLNRASGQRSDKRPVSADLRESSRAEHNASVVMMLYRPSLHGEDGQDDDAEIIVRKNRLGPLGLARASYHAPHNTWRDRT
jgi:replicative DNA helicase